jgi:site-specific recombinase XerC
MSELVSLSPPTRPALPALVAAAGDRAGVRFLEFFAANIRNPHTRRAYGRAVGEFLAWCESVGVASLAAVQPLHVASWIELEGRQVSAPSVKQRLAALRHLFDWLVTGQVVPVNPAASVRGPRHQGNHSLSGSMPARNRSASAGVIDAFTRRMKSGPMKA